MSIELARIDSPRPGESVASSKPSSITSRSHTSLGRDEDAPVNAVSLPPVDHGFHAWAYLVSAFMVELLVWSYPFSYGVFLDYYTTHTFKDHGSQTMLTLVGSLSTGLIYLSSVIVLPMMNRFPTYKRKFMALGVVLCVCGLLGAAFSTEPYQLVLTQGIVYSLGGSLLYFPVMTFMFEWFSEKRGIANGLIFSGTGVGGVVVPFVVESLLNKYGQRTTFIALAIGFAALIVPAFPFIKSRLPPAQITARQPIDTRFASYGPFWVLFAANLIQGLATFVPNIYMPTFMTDMDFAAQQGTLAVSLMNAASCPGYIALGWASDHYDLRISMILSTAGSSLAVLLLWGLAKSLAPILVFAIVYGFLAPSWSALWPRFITTVAGDDPHLTSTLMSIFIAGRGVGNVLAAPISGGLLRPWALTDKSASAYGLKGYGPLIIFTGLTLAASTVGISYRSFEQFGQQWRKTRVSTRFKREHSRVGFARTGETSSGGAMEEQEDGAEE